MAETMRIGMENLKTMGEEEILRFLSTDEAVGLTEEEALRRRRAYGPNIVVDSPQEYKKIFRVLICIASLLGWDSLFRQYKNQTGIASRVSVFLDYKHIYGIMCNFIVLMAFTIKVVSLVIPSAGQPPYELAIMVPLYMTCLAACIVAKHMVDRAKVSVDAKAFTLRAKVLRDGMWIDEHAANLVPGDIIFLKYGDFVPAVVHVLQGAYIETSNFWCTRHTHRLDGSLLYYAWAVTSGQGTAVVVATGHCITSPHPGNHQLFARPGQLRKGILTFGNFCVSLILLATIIEIIFGCFRQGHSYKNMMHDYLFLPLISGIPMTMPVILYLALAFGSLRLSSLGIASRGTVALEDLACVDDILFSMTGSLTCNKPCIDRGRIEVLADGVDKKSAILLAARASRAHYELYKEPIDGAILDLFSDPEQVTKGIQIIQHCAPFFVVKNRLYATTYIDENGSKCCVFKGGHCVVAGQCQCSKEVKERIQVLVEKLADDGYDTIAVGREVNSHWEIICLLPFKYQLRNDCVKAVADIVDMGLNIRVLTGSSASITKQLCFRLGKLGLHLMSSRSFFESGPFDKEIHLNTNGIYDLPPVCAHTFVKKLRTTFGRHCAMVGYDFSDIGAIRESKIGISIADATDCAKSESDLVLTQSDLLSIPYAVGVSRDTCQIMRGCMVHAVSSTVYIIGVRLFVLQWNFNLSDFLTLLIVAFSHCTSFVMLFERVKPCQLPDRWKVKKCIVTGATFGSYIVLSTILFFRVAVDSKLLRYGFGDKSLKRSDEEIRAALFLQMSIANQAIGLVGQSYNGHSINFPGPLGACYFILTQVVATILSVCGDLNFAQAKGVGWGCAGFIWIYNFGLLSALVLIYVTYVIIQPSSKESKDR